MKIIEKIQKIIYLIRVKFGTIRFIVKPKNSKGPDAAMSLRNQEQSHHKDISLSNKPFHPHSIFYKKSSIGKEIIAHRSERSVLDHPEGIVPYSVGGRKRIATCAGVAWIGNQHLVTVNLYAQCLRIYQLTALQNKDGIKYQLNLLYEKAKEVDYPDAVMVSPDHAWIAVAHSLSDNKGITLHRLSMDAVEVSDAITRLTPQYTCHGLHFSPNSKYLAFTTLETPGQIEVYDIQANPFTRVCLHINNHEHLRPKDICFTPDSKYVAIIYSEVVSIEYVDYQVTDRRLAIHTFNIITGQISAESIAVLQDSNFVVNSFELATSYPKIENGRYRFFITNQYADKIIEIVFDPTDSSLEIIGSFGGALSFPHGIDISPNGKLIAATNFGDDMLRIYELDKNKKVEDTFPHILLCAHSSMPPLFGAELSFLDLAKACNKLGFRISCLIPHENLSYTDELSKYVEAVHYIPYSWYDPLAQRSDEYISRVVKCIRKESVDILHINSSVISILLKASQIAGIPAIVHMRELLSEDFVLTKSMATNKDTLIHQISKDADFIICNSKKTKEQFKRDQGVFLVYNCIDPDRFELPSIPMKGVLKIGLISSNTVKKGIYDFLKLAIAALSNAELEFIMIGPQNEEVVKLNSQIESLNPRPRLNLIDYCSYPDQAMAMVDVVLSLTQVGESFGRTIAEAMAARRPVVAYGTGAVPELIVDGVTGFLIPPGDLKAVLDTLEWIASHRNEAKAMGERARQYVIDSFSGEIFHENLKKVYTSILNTIHNH